jgi:hypothetical protein
MKFKGYVIPEYFTATFYIVDNDGVKVTNNNFKSFKTWSIELLLKVTKAETIDVIQQSTLGSKTYKGHDVVTTKQFDPSEYGTVQARQFNQLQANRVRLISVAVQVAIQSHKYKKTASGGHSWTIGDQIKISETELEKINDEVTEFSYTKLDGSFYETFAERYRQLVIAGDKTPIDLTPSTNQSVINAARALVDNKDFIVAEVIAYINYTFGGFQYNKAKCFRDIGYMIDSVSFDLLHGGNRQAIQSGVYYYTFDGDQTAIPNEVTQTTAAYEYMKTLVSSIVTATPLTNVYQTATTQTLLSPATVNEVASISANIDLINNIITQGPSVGTNRAPIGLTPANSIAVQRAYALLKANRQFIIDVITQLWTELEINKTLGHNRLRI